MLIGIYKNNYLEEKNTLLDALNLGNKRIISFVGGGGKTSCIYNLSKELGALEKKVIITTTTHMFMPKENFVLGEDINKVKEALENNNVIVVGNKASEEKIKSMNISFYDELIKVCDYLLIEADGSKRLPLKAPALHEPVIIHRTEVIVGVVGIDALNKCISKVCHRPERVSEVLKKNISETINEEDIALLLSSKEGQMKYINNTIEYRALINKVDNKELLLRAFNISDKLQKKNIYTIITSFKE